MIKSIAMLQKTSLIMWSRIYPTNVKGVTILVKGEKLSLVDKVWINKCLDQKHTFTNKTLSWSESGGNPSNVELKFINKGDLVYGISGKNCSDLRQSYWSVFTFVLD